MAASLPLIAIGAALFAVLYPCYLAIKRLCFSPLSKLPSPKIAAASFWYEFYYDFWKSGMYIHEIKKMHAQYGNYDSINQ